MTQLIDKSALVAEIERKADIICQGVFSKEATMSVEYFKDSLISFLDTLDVKEVDLDEYYHDFLQREWFDKNCNRTMSEMMAFTAKHFFELGLKTQKGE